MPMRVHIFDVEHGECNLIETPSGDLMLIGVGHNSTTGWRPSSWLARRAQRPSCMVLNNLDRDHLSDLPSFEPALRPHLIVRNRSIDPAWLARKKLEESGEIADAMSTAIRWMGQVFTGAPVALNYGMEARFFCHSPALFEDTNNLSVVSFVRHNGCGLMFPGDMEKAGWLAFLSNSEFVDCLRRTNILIASHHGRQSGYCEEMFGNGGCAPHAVIISDKPVVHDTQCHNLYGAHCAGLYFGQTVRRVLTTRSDGKITIEVPDAGHYVVHINQSY